MLEGGGGDGGGVGGWWSALRPGRFTYGNDSVPIVKWAGLASGPLWTGTKGLAYEKKVVVKEIYIFFASSNKISVSNEITKSPKSTARPGSF